MSAVVTYNHGITGTPSATPHELGYDIHARIRWIRASIKDHNDNLDEDDSSLIWWPALLYNSHQELQKMIPVNESKLKSLIFMERKFKFPQQLHYSKNEPDKVKVALLLGVERPQNRTILPVPVDQEQSLLKCFYSHVDDFEKLYGGNTKWRQAYTEAVDRLASSTFEFKDMILSSPSGDVIVTGALKDEANISVVNSFISRSANGGTSGIRSRTGKVAAARNIISWQQQRETNGSGSSIHSAGSSVLSVNYPSPTKGRKENLKENKINQLTEPELGDQVGINGGNKSVACTENSRKSPHCTTESDQSQLRRLTPSPSKGLGNDEKSNSRHFCQQAVKDKKKRTIKSQKWSTVLEILCEDYGWIVESGKGIVANYFVKPEFYGMTLEEIRKKCQLNKDYFSQVESVKAYVREHYNWNDPQKAKDHIKRGSKKRTNSSPANGAVPNGLDEMYSASDNESIASRTRKRSLESSPSGSMKKRRRKFGRTATELFNCSRDNLLSSKEDTSRKMPPSNTRKSQKRKKCSPKKQIKLNSDNSSHLSMSAIRKEWSIPTNESAWDILKKAYNFKREGKYFCLPGVSPTEECYVNGEDYFEDLSLLRKNLCAYGIPSNGIASSLHETSQTRQELKRWIIYANIDRLKNETIVPNAFDTIDTFSHAWSYMEKIGFSYKSKGYFLPGVDMKSKSLIPGVHYFEALDLWIHLARFGVPYPTGENPLTERERLSLDIYIANCGERQRNVFVRIVNQDKKLRSRKSKRSCHQLKNASAFSKDLRAKTSAENSDTIKNSNLKERQERRKSTKTQFEKSPPETEKIIQSDILSDDKSKYSSNNVTQVSIQSDIKNQNVKGNVSFDGIKEKIRKGQNNQKCVIRPEINMQGSSNKLSTDVPDTRTCDLKCLSNQTTVLEKYTSNSVSFINAKISDNIGALNVREQLERCLKLLSPSYVADEVMFYGSGSESKFSEKSEDMISFLDKTVNSYQFQGRGSSSLMYVCGGPGTGKTSMVSNCINLVMKFFKRQESKVSPKCKFINAAHVQSSSNVLAEIADSIGQKSTDIRKIEQSLKFRSEKSKRQPLLLVLDEIDLLLSGRQTQEKKGEESFLKTLFRWASEPQYGLILIGISNSVGSKDAKRLHQIGKFDVEIVFESYTEDDLINIIKRRLGENVSIIDESVLKYVSRRIAKTSGDARRLLELMSSAVVKCKENLEDSLLDKKSDSIPVVKLKHVMTAMRDSGEMHHAQIIASLPQTAKVVLCVAMALSQVSPAWEVIQLSQLKTYCAEATRHNIMEGVSIDVLVDIVRNLEDAGLLKIGDDDDLFGNFYVDPHQWPLRLGVQLDDVECAIGEALLQNKFYKNLVTYVRERKDSH